MRSSKIVITLGIMFALGVPVAARADKVTACYDPAIDFSKYKTFMWIHKPQSKDTFMDEHIVTAVDEQLVRKGLRQVSEGADLAVGANLTTQQGDTCEAFDDCSGWRSDGWSKMKIRTDEVGTLTVNLFDGHSRKLAWQGVAVDEVSTDPIKRTREAFREIEEIFKDYPLKTHH